MSCPGSMGRGAGGEGADVRGNVTGQEAFLEGVPRQL